jgi:hypothetical protein
MPDHFIERLPVTDSPWAAAVAAVAHEKWCASDREAVLLVYDEMRALALIRMGGESAAAYELRAFARAADALRAALAAFAEASRG